MDQLKNQIAELSSQLQWIDDILMGKSVSEFAESFRIVREVAELKQDLQEWQDGEHNLRVDLLSAIRLLRNMSKKWVQQPGISVNIVSLIEINAFLERFSHWPE